MLKEPEITLVRGLEVLITKDFVAPKDIATKAAIRKAIITRFFK